MDVRLHVVAPSNAIGGAEHYLVKVIGGLIKRGYSITLIIKKDPKIEAFFSEHLEIPIISCNIGWQGGAGDSVLGESLTEKILKQAEAFVHALAGNKPDAMFVNLPWPDFGTGISLAAANLGIPTLVLCHLCPRVVIIPKELQAIYRGLAAAGQKYATVSDDNKYFFSASTSIPLSDISVLYNGISVDPEWASIDLKTQHDERLKLKQELGLPNDAKIAVTVGRLDFQKGHLDLIDAIFKVRDRCESLHYVWLGDGPLRGFLSKLVNTSGLSKTVHILGQRNDVSRFLALADFLIAPSIFEGFSLTLLEAASYRCPIISSDCSATRELITDPDCGLLYRTGRTTELAETIILATSNWEKMAAIGRQGHKQTSSFSYDKMLGTIETLVQDLIQHVKSQTPVFGQLMPSIRKKTSRKSPISVSNVMNWVQTVINVHKLPQNIAAPPRSMVAPIAIHRAIMASHRQTLRLLFTLGAYLRGKTCPIVTQAELSEWLEWRIWQYPVFWVIGENTSSSISIKLVQIDRSSSYGKTYESTTLATFVVPIDLNITENLIQNVGNLILAPRMLWQVTQDEVSFDPEPGMELPSGIAAGVAIEGGALHIIAQLMSYLGCSNVLASNRALSSIPFPSGSKASKGKGFGLGNAGAGFTFQSSDNIRVVEVLPIDILQL